MNVIARPVSNTDVDVIICGGGPVGLALAYLLGRWGLRTTLFEKRASTTILPKGQYVHAQTAELYRQWGVWSLLEKRGWPIEKSNGQGVYVNVSRGPVAQVRATTGKEADYAKKWERLTPVYPRKIPASDYEAALCQQARQWPSAEIHFSTRVVDVRPSDTHVTVRVRNENTGAEREVRGRYLVACDGAHSFVRNRVGQGEDHGPAFLNQVLVEFNASLDDTLGRDGFFHSFVIDPRYAGWFGSKHPDTGVWRYSFRHDEDSVPDHETIFARIRGALGMDIPIEILQIFRFDYTTGLLRRWREGNVFFAGDAAHWHSPWGGYGANSGVQDSNNLSWKLAMVLKGIASDSLLDTYEIERKAKAWQVVKAATYNSLHFQSIVQSVVVGEPKLATEGELSEVGRQFLQQRFDPHGDNTVLHTGFQLGTVYDSHAVIRDGAVAPVSDLKNYEETTVPGVRAPHVWLRDKKGQRLSIVDLWGTSFRLVISGDSQIWRQTVSAFHAETGIPLTLIDVSPEGDYEPLDVKFEKLYTKNGVVLVRPDGFVMRRFTSSPAADLNLLQETFRNSFGSLGLRNSSVEKYALTT
ncbi:hypothetical protein YH63_001990 [Afipia massiliensis]|uniref:FAD-binding domain-containing protein n=1 Tax=Afipia massiliensis TaxID=211460 RepID=A0A4U6BJC9_9BRAD|nr:FAD-dependent monooxygenase [Afipia massiliensis]TKT70280.1 hypothetical protein YH63_001990 [Afipia massiliensis]